MHGAINLGSSHQESYPFGIHNLAVQDLCILENAVTAIVGAPIGSPSPGWVRETQTNKRLHDTDSSVLSPLEYIVQGHEGKYREVPH